MNDPLQKQIGVKSVLKDITTEWCQSSTSHGLPNFFRTNSIVLKVMWACCFTACTIYCIYSIAIGIQSYLQYSTYISTQIVQEIPTNFPAVSLCSLKLTNKIKAKTYLDNILYYNGTPIFKLSDFKDDTYSFAISQLYYIQASISSDKSLNASSKRALGFELSDMLLKCTFNWETCTEADFVQFFHPMYGNCYTFNKGYYANGSSSGLRQVSVQGADYGLSINLFTGDPQVQSQYEFADGIIVVVHNQSTLPMLNGDRILVSTGAETDLKINRNFLSKLDYPYGNCLKDTTKTSTFTSEFFDYIVNKLGMKYTQDYCYLLCLQKKIINKCGCALGFLPSYADTVMCRNQTEIGCFAYTVTGFNKNHATDDCIQACPLECDTIEYDIKTSRSTYPSPYYKSLLAQNSKINASGIAYSDIEKATLRFNVYYETMKYTLTTEVKAITIDTFLSNIGGTLGLYLGISFLSLIEVLELAYNLLQTVIEFRLKRKVDENSKANNIQINVLPDNSNTNLQ